MTYNKELKAEVLRERACIGDGGYEVAYNRALETRQTAISAANSGRNRRMA
jgi:hypothetical protein